MCNVTTKVRSNGRKFSKRPAKEKLKLKWLPTQWSSIQGKVYELTNHLKFSGGFTGMYFFALEKGGEE